MTSLSHQNYRNEYNYANENTKKNWYDKKTVGVVKQKIVSPFKTNTKKDYYKPRKLEIKKKKQSEDKIIRAIKYIIIRYIKNLFEQKEDSYKSVKVIFIETIISNIRVIVIEINPYQSNDTLMKLNHT